MRNLSVEEQDARNRTRSAIMFFTGKRCSVREIKMDEGKL
jgi:hypothetical protein